MYRHDMEDQGDWDENRAAMDRVPQSVILTCVLVIALVFTALAVWGGQ